jgi:hypothetical protein
MLVERVAAAARQGKRRGESGRGDKKGKSEEEEFEYITMDSALSTGPA